MLNLQTDRKPTTCGQLTIPTILGSSNQDNLNSSGKADNIQAASLGTYERQLTATSNSCKATYTTNGVFFSDKTILDTFTDGCVQARLFKTRIHQQSRVLRQQCHPQKLLSAKKHISHKDAKGGKQGGNRGDHQGSSSVAQKTMQTELIQHGPTFTPFGLYLREAHHHFQLRVQQHFAYNNAHTAKKYTWSDQSCTHC